MKSKPAKLVIGAVMLVLAGIIFVTLLAPSDHLHQLIRKAMPIQVALESYRQQHGNYPESLSAAKIPQPDEIYYKHQPDGSYLLWFDLQPGESLTLDSIKHTWK